MAIKPEQLAASGSEHAHQTALMQWCALNVGKYPQLKWIYAVPNGFYSSAAQKAKMKAEGLRNGVPDVFLPVPKCYPGDHYPGMYGLYIEMKIEKYRNTKDGGCSEDQLEWLDYLKQAGYKTAVCYSWTEAVKVIETYLNGE